MTFFEIPIFIPIYNRSDHLVELLTILKKIKPKIIYFCCDGPKNKNDKELVYETRNFIISNQISKKVKYKFLKYNHGCKDAVIKGINWFFDNEKQGIILEDDCIPSLSFFYFCKENLRYHKKNKKIMNIGGLNLLNEIFNKNFINDNKSYFFTSSPMIWGWATWKDRWSLIDVKMKNYKKIIKNEELIKKLYHDSKTAKFYLERLKEVKEGRDSSWAYIWDFTLRINSGLNITPKKNLVKNIGFGINQTHKTPSYSRLSLLNAHNIGKIVHNNDLKVNYEADKELTEFFSKKSMLENLFLILSKIKKLI